MALSVNTVIDGNDYWEVAKWRMHNAYLDSNSSMVEKSDTVPGSYTIVADYKAYDRDKEAQRVDHNARLAIVGRLALMVLTSLSVGTILLQRDINPIIQIMAIVFSAFVVGKFCSYVMEQHTGDFLKSRRTNLSMEEIVLQDVTWTQANEIINDLNYLKKEDNKKAYMSIVQRILQPAVEEREQDRVERLERKTQMALTTSKAYM